ncbi:MAG: precorrin-2 dehydrogenase/sirohydrochlorin ferrochelatase family protein [Armatimonadota bacterium]
MPEYYPVFLNLRGRQVLVIGGGQVALRKVQGLLGCGAVVKVIAPEVVPALEELAREGRINLSQRAYEAGDLQGASLVIASTNQREVNAQVSAEAAERGIFVNVVDDPELCSFILPSVLSWGDLVVAVSTGGRSPLLARQVRDLVADVIGPEYGEMAALMGRLRPEVRKAGATEADRARIWRKVLASPAMDLLREGKVREAEEVARACISSSSD